MEPIYVDWATLRTFAGARGLSIQWVVVDNTYRCRALDGFFALDCSIPMDGGADQTEFETTYRAAGNKPVIQNTVVQMIPAIGAKTITVGGVVKKLFARNTGIQQLLAVGANEIEFIIAYPWVKILGLECINCEALDTGELRVYDNALGSYSGTPNQLLNQFGYSLNLAAGFYMRTSPFDADLYAGMVLKITYNSLSAKTIGINIIMNEVKS